MNFYDSIIEGAQELTVQERGQLYVACLEYLRYDGREPEFAMRPAARAVYLAVRPVLDNQLSAQERGRKGGRPRKSESKPKAEVSERQPKAKKPTESKPKAEVSKVAPETESSGQARLFGNAQFSKSEQEQEQEREKPSPDGEGKKRPKRARPFVPPSVEEVARVARERNLTLVDPEAFWAHYDAQGWVNGNGIPLVSWESKLIGWNSAERLRRQGAGAEGAYDATYD